MRKILEAKYIILGAIVLTITGMLFVLFSMMGSFYMDRGYTIPLIITTIITVVLIQKSDREDQSF